MILWIMQCFCLKTEKLVIYKKLHLFRKAQLSKKTFRIFLESYFR